MKLHYSLHTVSHIKVEDMEIGDIARVIKTDENNKDDLGRKIIRIDINTWRFHLDHKLFCQRNSWYYVTTLVEIER